MSELLEIRDLSIALPPGADRPLARSAAQHLDLVAAIESRDAVWAEAAMCAHIHAAKQVIFGVPAQAGGSGQEAPAA